MSKCLFTATKLLLVIITEQKAIYLDRELTNYIFTCVLILLAGHQFHAGMTGLLTYESVGQMAFQKALANGSKEISKPEYLCLYSQYTVIGALGVEQEILNKRKSW